MRILVTGSRSWTDEKVILGALLEQWHTCGDDPELMTLVHGAARGADSIAAGIADDWGWWVEPHPVSRTTWKYDRQAGFHRSQRMVDLGADVCLAFIAVCVKSTCHRPRPHDSHGAADCADRADKAGIRTLRRRL